MITYKNKNNNRNNIRYDSNQKFKQKHQIPPKLSSANLSLHTVTCNACARQPRQFSRWTHHRLRSRTMADKAQLQGAIKIQGEVVRKLKSEKASKDQVSLSSPLIVLKQREGNTFWMCAARCFFHTSNVDNIRDMIYITVYLRRFKRLQWHH